MTIHAVSSSDLLAAVADTLEPIANLVAISHERLGLIPIVEWDSINNESEIGIKLTVSNIHFS